MSGISIGVTNTSGQHAHRVMETQRGQAAHLIPLIQECLKEVNLSFSDLQLIGATRGPGSFTGLRIGLTTAKTLGLSLNIPVIGLNTLDLMALHVKSETTILVVLETKRSDFYACTYNKQTTPLRSPAATDAETIASWIKDEPITLITDCGERFKSEISIDITNTYKKNQPSASVMVQMTRNIFYSHQDTTTDPLYLRGADISHPKVLPRKLKS